MGDLGHVIYVEPPQCSHRALDKGGFCYACGATLRWVVEREVNAIKAADAFNAEMVRITDKSSAVEMRAVCAAINAAIGGDDG